MAVKGPGASPQSMTVLQRLARLYEGERWWLADPQAEVRGLLCLDGGPDLKGMRAAIIEAVVTGAGFAVSGVEIEVAARPPAARPPAGRHDCQVTVEERTQLFGFLRKG